MFFGSDITEAWVAGDKFAEGDDEIEDPCLQFYWS